jgi:hypothetical protein
MKPLLLRANESGRTRYYLHLNIRGQHFVVSRFGVSWTARNSVEHATYLAAGIAFTVALVTLISQAF